LARTGRTNGFFQGIIRANGSPRRNLPRLPRENSSSPPEKAKFFKIVLPCPRTRGGRDEREFDDDAAGGGEESDDDAPDGDDGGKGKGKGEWEGEWEWEGT
jgi:hypothetical protein